jgi:hypothetical protein
MRADWQPSLQQGHFYLNRLVNRYFERVKMKWQGVQIFSCDEAFQLIFEISCLPHKVKGIPIVRKILQLQ